MDIQEIISRFYSRHALKKYLKQLEAVTAAKARLNLQTVEQAFAKYNSSSDKYEQLACMSFAIKDSTGKDPFDTQLLCALALIDGRLAEMKTGEGKTLTVGLAASVLAKKGAVHIVTSNQYLAYRDAHELAGAFNRIGLSVGLSLDSMSTQEKQIAYACNVTYTTANELGFDYLRDNTAARLDLQVQTRRESIIVDEADFLLIDEARTPLILSGNGKDQESLINLVWDAVSNMSVKDFDLEVELKSKQVTFSAKAFEHLEKVFIEKGLITSSRDLYIPQNMHLISIAQACANAKHCYRKDSDYVVRDQEIKLVDEGTGRIMEGKRWSNFLHSATEAKEGVPIKAETETLASITLQSFLKKYKHLCGLTGTALTEAEELSYTYGLECVAIPTRKPVIRNDMPDRIFASREAKLKAVLNEVQGRVQKNQPVLLACESVAESQTMSDLLKKANIKHNLLNGKDPENEAYVISVAGLPSQVTVTTQIAGRGTDIILGGPEDAPDHKEKRDVVLNAGGLHVLFTCTNLSRRIDNQLRGRAGRQGDPGSSQRFSSLDDDLAQAFGAGKLKGLMEQVSVDAGFEISTSIMVRAFKAWQISAERRGFEARKEVAKYDEAFTSQREAVYELRQALLEGKVQDDYFIEIMTQATFDIILKSEYWSDFEPNWKGIEDEFFSYSGLELEFGKWFENTSVDSYPKAIELKYAAAYDKLRDVLQYRHRLQLDENWKNYLLHLESIKEGIHLQAYANKNPVHVFKEQAFQAFSDFKLELGRDLLRNLVVNAPEEEKVEELIEYGPLGPEIVRVKDVEDEAIQ